ncbi:hypothetical protein WP12_01630 [Sphingomonas sp. SRS2]|nr:hypothetical protein WP12_01630 [Sphingomonas sp. SRS2]
MRKEGEPSARALVLGVAAIWLFTSLILLWMSYDRVAGLVLWDADDYLRFQQVRDWLAGQSFFDVRQYRLDPPAGVAMHWSRLVDLPLAGLILLLQPVLGMVWAERIAILVVPLITLGGAFAAITLMTARLAGRRAALAAAMLAAMTPLLLFHDLPMRIDHHGWQTMFGLFAVASCFDRRALRGGILAGVAMALWLAISLEGLPMAIAIAAVLALRFVLADADQDAFFRFRAFALSLGSAGLLLFAATHDAGAWQQTYCDAFGPAWFGPFALAPLMLGLALPLVAGGGAAPRLALLFMAGGLGAALTALVAPLCLHGPFAALDPVTRHYWYDNVVEGLPIWRQALDTQLGLALFPPIGLIGTLLAWRGATTRTAARNWLMMFALGLASFGLALLVQRAGGFAHALGLPGAGWLLTRGLATVDGWRRALLRVPASVALLLLVSPVGEAAVTQWARWLAGSEAEKPKPREPLACGPRCDLFGGINQLPRSYILAGLDVTPSLLVSTPHSYAGSGHHRGLAGIRRVIDSFIGHPDVAHRIMRDGGMGYVLIDPTGGEAILYSEAAPNGLMARLVAGRPPAWLKPVPLETSSFRMWRRVE